MGAARREKVTAQIYILVIWLSGRVCGSQVISLNFDYFLCFLITVVWWSISNNETSQYFVDYYGVVEAF